MRNISRTETCGKRGRFLNNGDQVKSYCFGRAHREQLLHWGAQLAISAGPRGKDVAIMAGRLGAIGYSHRVKAGINPVAAMPRVMLMIRGLGRAKGLARRKLLMSAEDTVALKGMLELMRIDRKILWATVLIGWFFMVRLIGPPDSKNPLTPDGRRSVLVSDIYPMCGGKLAHCGGSSRRNRGTYLWTQGRLTQPGMRKIAYPRGAWFAQMPTFVSPKL